jgi:hypothetical protein
MPIDIPHQLDERVTCSIAAATRYQIPANVMLAVAEKEAGKPGQWARNANGTFDVGAMQFNSAYLGTLARYGITAGDVAAAGCYSYDLAAWRLRQHITKDVGDLWARCANYHSRTPRLNAVYRADLMRRATRWADWLSARYQTREIEPARAVPAGRAEVAAKLIDASLAGAGTEKLAGSPTTSYVARKLIIENAP